MTGKRGEGGLPRLLAHTLRCTDGVPGHVTRAEGRGQSRRTSLLPLRRCHSALLFRVASHSALPFRVASHSALPSGQVHALRWSRLLSGSADVRWTPVRESLTNICCCFGSPLRDAGGTQDVLAFRWLQLGHIAIPRGTAALTFRGQGKSLVSDRHFSLAFAIASPQVEALRLDRGRLLVLGHPRCS